MTCVEQFIIENQDNLRNLCVRKVRNGEDLFQDLAVWVLTDLKAKELCAKDQLLYYCIRMISISGFSKNTPYYYKYDRHQNKTLPIMPWLFVEDTEAATYEIEMQWIEDNLKDLPWFEARVFEVYHWHSHSLKTLSDETGIAKSTINKAINKAKAHLKKEARRVGGRRGIRNQSDRNRPSGQGNP